MNLCPQCKEREIAVKLFFGDGSMILLCKECCIEMNKLFKEVIKEEKIN